MGSIIRSISFKNFYNFYGDYNDNIYYFGEGLNIVNADNGMGKSKIFNGFLWVIKDQVYDADTKTTISADLTPLKLLSDKAKLLDDTPIMGVRIVFDCDNIRYEVCKSIRYEKKVQNPSTSNTSDWEIKQPRIDILQTDLISNNTITIYDTDEQKKILNSYIINPDMQSYALLQGEAIDNIVDLSNAKRLASTVEALTDIGELKNIERTCQVLAQNAGRDLQTKQSAQANDQFEFESLAKKKKFLEEQIVKYNESRDVYQADLERAKETYEKLLSKIANTEKRVEYREKIKRIKADIARVVEERDQLLASVNDKLFKSNMPWILLNTNGYVDQYIELREQYMKDRAKIEILSNPGSFFSPLPEGSPDDGSLKMMLQKGCCFVCGREAKKGSPEWRHIESVLNRSKQIEESASVNDLHSFFGDIQKSVTSLTNVDEIKGDIACVILQSNQLEGKIKKLNQDLKDTTSEFLNYGGEDSSKDKDADENLVNRFARAQSDQKKYADLIKEAEKQIQKAEEDIKRIDQDMKKCGGKDVPQEYEDMKDLIDDARIMFSNMKERIYNEVISTLEKKANHFYQELTKGNAVYGGHLKFERTSYDTIDINVIDARGNQLTEASEGFQRMKKVAIVMAIISSKLGESHFVYPFIADAPFSAYGRNFINNFLEAVPAVFNQSIILIKELYDVNAATLITDDGNKLLDRLKDGEIEGSFYVNSIINDEGATLVDGKGDRITQTTKIEQRKAPCYE